MRWPRWVRWPWRKRSRPSMPTRTAAALRHLYFNYQKQRRMWGYSVLSSMALMCLFVVMSLFTDTNLWVLAIPTVAIIFSFFQMRRCSGLVRVLRHALIVQNQIDRAQAKAEREAEEAAKQAEEEATGLSSEGPAERDGPPTIAPDGPAEEADES